MRVNRAQAEENRRNVIDTASRLFREHGFDGVGLNELMRAAGLTHGGFYKQFKSKDDLIEQACGHALDKSADALQQTAGAAGDQAFATLVRRYLSPEHRDRVADGCAFAALGADAARQDSTHLSRHFEAALKRYEDVFAKAMPSASREAVLFALSTMVGALVLARTVDDDAYSRQILDTAAASLLANQST